MSTKSWYKIEALVKGKTMWVTLVPYGYMQKSFAMGAWSMLKSFYNHDTEYRLVKGASEVIDHCTKQTIKLN